MPILLGHVHSYILFKNVLMMSDNNLIPHELPFIAAHFSFIIAHLCSDNPLF